jgi:hypothetical protein
MWTHYVVAAALICSAEAFAGGTSSFLLPLAPQMRATPRTFAAPLVRSSRGSARQGIITLRAIGDRPSENKVTTDQAWDPATFDRLEEARCAELEEIFKKFDSTGGGLDASALQGALKDVRGKDVSLDNAQQIVDLLDENGDGLIDFQEFQKACPCNPLLANSKLLDEK